MAELNFDNYAEEESGVTDALAAGQGTSDAYLNRIVQQDAKLKAFEAAEDARDIDKKAKHYEGKSTPFMVQAVGRGVEQWGRSYSWLAKPFLNEEEMIEFHKEDERIAAGFNQAMDMGGLGATHKFLANGLKDSTDMAGKMVVSAYTGGMPSLYVQYGAQGLNQTYHQARVAGLSKEDSLNHASLMTAIEIGTMALFHAGSKFFPKIMPDIESRIVAELGGSLGASSGRRMASRATSKVVNDSLMKSFGRGAGKMLWEGGVETAEEVGTAVGQAMARAAQIPGAEDEANWTDKNGSVLNSPMMLTALHTARDTAGAMVFINGAPKIKNGIRRFLNAPSRGNALAAAKWLVAIGAADSVESLKSRDVRESAQKIALNKL